MTLSMSGGVSPPEEKKKEMVDCNHLFTYFSWVFLPYGIVTTNCNAELTFHSS